MRPHDLAGQYGGATPRRNIVSISARPEFVTLPSKARKAFLSTASILLLASVANAQQAPTQGPPQPGVYKPFSDAARPPTEGPRPIELTQTPPTAYRTSLSMTG